MVDPAELIDVAWRLSGESGASRPTDAQIRRAVSTAYYAVFHTVLRAAADRFVGPGSEGTVGYRVLYRSFDHAQMRAVCEDLGKQTLTARYKTLLGRQAISPAARDFALEFPGLQEARHSADYDPTTTFRLSEAGTLVEIAERTISTFHSLEDSERTDILAVLMVKVRA